MKFRWLFPCLVFISGCDRIISSISFFPSQSDPVAVEKHLPSGIKPITLVTPDQERLSCFLLPAASDRLLIYFHGNAQNIDMRLPELEQFRAMGVTVLGVGYRGYGRSTGKPSETGIYCDGQTALKYATDTLGYTLDNIFLCGRSIGTTVAVNTAQNIPVRGVILITPLSSGREFAQARHIGFLTSLLGNPFDNLSKCVNIKSPVLVIHGTRDEIIPYALGVRLCEALPGKKRMVTIQNGKHNDLEQTDPEAYWEAIQAFIGESSL